MKQVDARGLSCPQPVIVTKHAMRGAGRYGHLAARTLPALGCWGTVTRWRTRAARNCVLT